MNELLLNLIPKKTDKRAVAGVADDQVGPAVAVEVGRDDLRRQAAGRERSEPDEAAVPPGVDRDRIVVGVDTGEDGALIRVAQPRRCRATESPGLTVTGGSKVPGCPAAPGG